MRPTTAQERMDLLQEVNEAARDAMEQWCRRWPTDYDGAEVHLRWQSDGTAILEVNGDPTMRVSVEIAVSATEYEEASGA